MAQIFNTTIGQLVDVPDDQVEQYLQNPVYRAAQEGDPGYAPPPAEPEPLSPEAGSLELPEPEHVPEATPAPETPEPAHVPEAPTPPAEPTV